MDFFERWRGAIGIVIVPKYIRALVDAVVTMAEVSGLELYLVDAKDGYHSFRTTPIYAYNRSRPLTGISASCASPTLLCVVERTLCHLAQDLWLIAELYQAKPKCVAY